MENGEFEQPEGSPKYKVNKADLARVARGAGYALAGALLTYLTSVIPNIDFGQATPLVVAFWSVVSNLAVKFLKDNSSK